MNRRIAGRAAKSAGDLFEAWCQIHYDRALADGIVVHPVEHNEAHTKIAGGRLRFVGKGITDRTGLLANDKTLAIEEKSTCKDYLTKKAVKPKQAAYLDAIARKGHVALLLVEFRVVKSKFAIPWLLVPWRVRKTAESVVLADLDPAWRVAEDERCFLARFCAERIVPVVQRRVYPRD